MILSEYMVNPMGKGSSVLMLPELRRTLDAQYAELSSKIIAVWYSYQSKYMIAHVKIPSRHIEKLFYDVVIEIDMDSIPSTSTVINGANVKVFSNCPSFTFTYAKVMDDKGNMIDWLKRKYSKEIFANDPIKRNPAKVLSYERSLYFAIKYITTNGRNYKKKADYQIHKLDSHVKLANLIRTSDAILSSYQIGKKKLDEKKKAASTSGKDRAHKEKTKRPTKNEKTVKKVGPVKHQNKTKTVAKTKSTKTKKS